MITDRDKKQSKQIRQNTRDIEALKGFVKTAEAEIDELNIDVADLANAYTLLEKRVIALEDDKPQPDPTYVNSEATLRKFITDYLPHLVTAEADTGAETKAYCEELQIELELRCANLARHPSWGPTGHWDAIWDQFLDQIIDLVRDSTGGGKFWDKLQWILVS